MLDRDLAELYGVPTKALNQAVKRNIERFPEEFMFAVSGAEMEELVTNCDRFKNMKHSSVPMRAFTEHGIIMLASVLKSNVATVVSVRITRTFVAMRRTLAALAPLLSRIEATERRQLKQEEAQVRNEERFKLILDAMQDKSFPPQKVFYDGQIYDAFEQMKKFVRLARTELIVIDPRFNAQYGNSLTVRTSDNFHDRFLIIDKAVLIHVGASLNHLGKKCFAFSSMDKSNISDIVAKI